MSKPIALLHIYGQEAWHDNVYIVGNALALTRLRNAINAVLGGPSTAKTEAFASDGEGFGIYVICNDDAEKWGKLRVPYTQEYSRDGRATTIEPQELEGKP